MKGKYMNKVAACLILAGMTVNAVANYGFSSGGSGSNCTYRSVTAAINEKGAVTYTVAGDCGGAPMSGTLSYDPHSRVFHEKFFQSANFESMGDCPADP